MTLVIGFQCYWITLNYSKEKKEFDQKARSTVISVRNKIMQQSQSGPQINFNPLTKDSIDPGALYQYSNSAYKYYLRVYSLDFDKSLSEKTQLAIQEIATILEKAEVDNGDDIEMSAYEIFHHRHLKDHDDLSVNIAHIPVDSIFNNTLTELSPSLSYSYGIYNIPAKKWIAQNSSIPDSILLNTKYKLSFTDEDITTEDFRKLKRGNILFLYINQPENYFYKKILFSLVTSLLLVLITGLTIFYLLKTILRQKKLSEIKTDFINNMTHELKTPLATINFAVANIENEAIVHTPEKIKEITKVIKEESNRMNAHVELVLRTAQANRKELKIQKESLNVHQLLNLLISSFEVTLPSKEAFIIREFNASNAILFADKVHLSNVFSNLLDNAIKYAGDQIKIIVETFSDAKGITIRISDNGIGIKKEHVDKIFEQFYRVPTGNIHNIKGFGLGLTYSRAIIQEHDGTINVESKYGKGSTFIVFLPFNNMEI